MFRRTLIEHLLSIAFVGLLFLLIGIQLLPDNERRPARTDPRIEALLDLEFVDYDNPLHKTFLKETLHLFYPDSVAYHDSLLQSIDAYRAAQFQQLTRQRSPGDGLSWSKLGELLGMYVVFILAYLIVMVLTYYGVHTLAVFRFVKMKQQRTSYIEEFVHFLRNNRLPNQLEAILRYIAQGAQLAGKAILKGFAYLILFSPAYVIAYSFKTRFDTNSFLFMVLLGVISNGLLITYAQKFYTYLITESRKGYVQTAMVKNLNAAYHHSSAEGIPYKWILRWRKSFPGHVFQHIYLNARYQYLSTIKEQASFLITGLVIIEMALNIQGHFTYELLQNILYKQYDVVLTIIFGIFLVVKATEVFTDYWMHREAMKYENQ